MTKNDDDDDELTLEDILAMAEIGMRENKSNFHIWAGKFSGTKKEFECLFDLSSFYASKEGDNFEICAFAKYLDTDAHEEDFFGYEYTLMGIETLIKSLPGESLQAEVNAACKKIGICEPNAIIYYGDIQLSHKVNLGNEFEGLRYLGVFEYL